MVPRGPRQEEREGRSRAVEDYLSTIYRMEQGGEKSTTSAVANRLGVSAASTTSMFQKLAAEGLVEYREYTGVSLTPKGQRIAADVVRRHRLAERFLTDILDIPWDRVDEMAHKMEHVLPKEVIEGFDRLLGNPAVCPHGYPIPRSDGAVETIPVQPLLSLEPGERRRIHRVDEQDPELLRYLAEHQLVPGSEVEVVAKPPFDEPLTLRVGERVVTVGVRIASSVYVAAEEGDPPNPGVAATPAPRDSG